MDGKDEAKINTVSNEEGDETPPEDEGDLIGDTYYGCEGFCNPEREFRWWGGHSAYPYVAFESGFICEDFYRAWRKDFQGLILLWPWPRQDPSSYRRLAWGQRW